MKPKLIKLDNQGEPKAKCNNCGKEYDIYGKPAHTDLFNKIKIDDCSDIYNTETCKEKK